MRLKERNLLYTAFFIYVSTSLARAKTMHLACIPTTLPRPCTLQGRHELSSTSPQSYFIVACEKGEEEGGEGQMERWEVGTDEEV